MNARFDERFEMRARLGRGAFGEVFRALDRERGVEVALKRLHRVEPRAIVGFKHAFRSLAELRHENLAALYELLSDGERWVITMEFVPGVDVGTWAGDDVERWGAALAQIGRGLSALHDAGHLHRDLTAANIKVTPEGRVVLLDFGLLGRIGEGGELVGSLHAIPPEMLERKPLGPAADWYALGALLYEALHGRPPFQGRSAEVLAKKLRSTPSTDRDDPLSRLAVALLHRDPSVRLEAASRFGLPVSSRDRAQVFVGRQTELATMEDALARARSGQRMHLRVRGSSGMGKTALVTRFSRSVPGALFGRCFEHEAVPFAGLDSVIDRMALLETAPIDDEEGAALATLFPVLRRRWAPIQADPTAVVARAGRALSRLASAHAGGAAIIVLDDMQWGDEDGARLLTRLGPEPLLLVTVERTGEGAGRFLPVLDGAWPPDVVVELGPLDAASVAELAPHATEELLAETEGRPLLLQEALRGGQGRSVPEAMRARIESLRSPERTLLALLAAAARPLSRELALLATELLRSEASFDALTGLRAARLLELRHTTSGVTLELAHPSIAEAGRALDERPEVHAALDDAMEALELDEPENQGRHALAAGRRERARLAFERAAEQAMATFAFDRAVRLFQAVLDLEPSDPAAVEARLGAALSALGRSAEAAEAFERALRGRRLTIDDPVSIELGRRRAEQWLHAGRIREGQEALREVLAAAGLPYPSPSRALVSVASRQLWLKLRGTRVSRARGRPEDSLRSDLCFSAGQALSSIDSIRGADFVFRSLSLALAAGDRWRVARSLAFVASYATSAGPPGAERTRRAIAELEREAMALDEPYLRGMLDAARCLCAFHLADYRTSHALAEAAESIFRRVPDASRERVTAQIYQCASLAMMGEWERMEAARKELLEDSRARRDRFGSTNGGSGLMNAGWLVKGDPERARREAEEAIASWSGEGFHVQHFFDLIAQGRIDLYEGRPQVALRRVQAARPRIRRSLTGRPFFVRVHVDDLEARALVGVAARAKDPEPALERARKIARRIRRRGDWALPFADAIDGACFVLSGQEALALGALRRSRDGYARFMMRAHARAIDRSLVSLGGNPTLPPDSAVQDEAAFTRVLAPIVVRD